MPDELPVKTESPDRPVATCPCCGHKIDEPARRWPLRKRAVYATGIGWVLFMGGQTCGLLRPVDSLVALYISTSLTFLAIGIIATAWFFTPPKKKVPWPKDLWPKGPWSWPWSTKGKP